MTALLLALFSLGLVATFTAGVAGLWFSQKLFRAPDRHMPRTLLTSATLAGVHAASFSLGFAALQTQQPIPLIALVFVGAFWMFWISIRNLMNFSSRQAALACLIVLALQSTVVESFVIPFRNFVAEMFVVPTGAMAPTVLGRHKHVTCQKCDCTYDVSASAEAEDATADHGPSLLDRVREQQVVAATCPLCRYPCSTDPDTESGRQFPSQSGDRVVVGKTRSEPQRWDIIVFRYPDDRRTNYVKRLVGLPGEAVKIARGDIWTKSAGETEFHIARKDPGKLRDLLHPVYDNDCVVDAMTKAGWPLRWQPWPGADGQQPDWQSKDGGRTFQLDRQPTGEAWLRYQHFVPLASDWAVIERGSIPKDVLVLPQLITDFYAYNSFEMRGHGLGANLSGLHWVGDLLVEADVDVKSNTGALLVDLVEGGKHFRATVDVATGQATLAIDGVKDFRPVAQTSIKGRGKYHVGFANIDDELTLWVDDHVVKFDGPTTYSPLGNDYPQATEKDLGDLAPAGIGSRGAQLKVSKMRVWRDVYYIAERLDPRSGGGLLTDYPKSGLDRQNSIASMDQEELADFMSTPETWKTFGPGQINARREVTFPLKADQFFMLGDNSPQSKDGRLWETQHWVERELLIGRVTGIYWPIERWREL